MLFRSPRARALLARIWEELEPLCIRGESGEVHILDVESEPQDVRAVVNVDFEEQRALGGRLHIRGEGFYTEVIQDPKYGPVTVVWVLDLTSDEARTREQIESGTVIPVTIVQQGFRRSVPLTGQLETTEGGAFRATVPIYYEDKEFPVSTATIKSVRVLEPVEQ